MDHEPESLEPPVTATRLVTGLRALGVAQGEVLLVHSALRALAGRRSMVLGGPVAVVEALQQVLGPDGTLVMPAFSADYSEPSRWNNPPAPPDWWPIIRSEWPAYRSDATPTLKIGLVPETFRAMRGVRRSDHPHHSFCAWGARAEQIVGDHPLEAGLGGDGPLGVLYRLDARVLMLGCGWGSCTCFHLAEHRMQGGPPTVRQGAPIMRDGERIWARWSELDIRADDFEALGHAFERSGAPTTATVGRATARVFALREAVDFAVPWLEQHR